jgi:DNA replication protein DnaC
MTTETTTGNLATLKPKFKRDCLSYILTDQEVAKTAVANLPDDFFEFNPELHIIFSGLKEFVETYNCRPRRHELEETLEETVTKSKWDKDQRDNLFAALDAAYAHDEYSPTRVKDKLYEGITAHNVLQVTKQIPDFVEEGDWDGLMSAVAKARHSAVEEETFVEYWTDIEDRIERRKHEHILRIPTKLEAVDDLITGGVPRGSLAMLMGGSGYGKSAILAQIALNASLQGYTVAFLTLELNRDAVMARLDANIGEVPLNDIGSKPTKLTKKLLKRFSENPTPPGSLYVQYYPTKSVSVRKVEEYVKRLRDEKGISVDLLLVDYFDLLKMEGSYDKKYEALEENIEILRGIGGLYDMAIWTASQVNRGGLGKEIVDMDDIAGGFGKVFPLDLLITISQTKHEKVKEVFRLHFAKSRLGPSGGVVYVLPNFDMMRFTVMTEAEADAKGFTVKESKKRAPKTTMVGTPGGV